MNKTLRNTIRNLAAATCLSAAIAPAFAGPIFVFSTSVGTQPSNVGTITLTQIDATTVDVLVDLNDTSLPLPRYGFVNTGGPHTPFAFSISGTESGLSATFLQPTGGSYTFGMFSMNTGGGSATPYGTYGIAIDSTAGNGTSNAYFGDLEFQLTRASGLSTDDFVSNGTAFFAADLTDGFGATGSQAWQERTTVRASVPEPQTAVLLGIGLLSIAASRRRRQAQG